MALKVRRLIFLLTGVLVMRCTAAFAQLCGGDCDASGMVQIHELVTCVAITLGTVERATCAACDVNGDDRVTIDEIIRAVRNAETGCPPSASPTPTHTEVPTPTVTTNPRCPLQPGAYTLRSVPGGSLNLTTFQPFGFPADTTIVADVGSADADCVHHAVIPFPSGFSSPTFCIPATGYSIRVRQTGCGVAVFDSDGGADFTMSERGDTSDASSVCHTPQDACPPGAHDRNIRAQVTVGDQSADTCTGSGRMNAVLSIPVETTIWLEGSGYCGTTDFTESCAGDVDCGSGLHCRDGFCDNGADGTVDEDDGDLVVARIPQVLDFTTDTIQVGFEDLDADGCFRSGNGPGGFSRTGSCLDLGTLNTGEPAVTLGAAGIAEAGAPLWDIVVALTLPSTIEGPQPSLGATCTAPLARFDVGGTVDRCIAESP